jgi:hypothetical protein
MSAFIRLDKQDAFVVPYTAHKSFFLTASAYSGSAGVEFYRGTRNRTSLFTQTEATYHNEYPRLVYDSINHLYYSNFTASIESGSYDNYNQSTLFYTRSLSVVDGEDIFVVAVQRDRFGEAIEPTSFTLTSGSLSIIDDGEGNLITSNDFTWTNTVYTFYSESATVSSVPDASTLYLNAGLTPPSGYTFVSASWTGDSGRNPFYLTATNDPTVTITNAGVSLDDNTGKFTTDQSVFYFVDNSSAGSTMDVIYVSSSQEIKSISSGYRVGNIFYPHGMAVVNSTADLVDLLHSTAQYSSSINWQATHTIYQHEYRCKIRESSLNYSQNPSIKYGSYGTLYDFATGSYFQPYVTTIGLYNDANELIAVGKLAQPVPKSRYIDMTFVVKFDV